MNSTEKTNFNIFNFTGKMKTLHLTWFAFFLTFLVWFNHAPLLSVIQESFGLTNQEVKSLLILNVALTIPARVVIGMLVDKLGPRLLYSSILAISGILCLTFALSTSYMELAISRFLLGFVGAGFVVGIRMVGEWFPAKEVGLAEGIYGGWGNFGSAVAALTIPTMALIFGGENGWRYAIGSTGVISFIYAFVYYSMVKNTPKGSTYFKPKKLGAMEVSSKSDLVLYLFMNIPMYLVLGVLTWKLGPTNLGVLNSLYENTIYGLLFATYIFQSLSILRINKQVLKGPVPKIHRYKFKQVAVLNISYFITFGSELTVVSMLPLFFKDIFGLSIVMAGLLASTFAFTNLVTRPSGGFLSDKFGRKKTLVIFLFGMIVGYLLMSQMSSNWPIVIAVLVTMFCSSFGQAGSGAIFAMVPLVKRRLTGQVAGTTGAYGSVGAVTYLTIFSFVSPQILFLTIAGSSLIVLIIVQLFMEEPSGHMVEVLPDGTIERISIS